MTKNIKFDASLTQTRDYNIYYNDMLPCTCEWILVDKDQIFAIDVGDWIVIEENQRISVIRTYNNSEGKNV